MVPIDYSLSCFSSASPRYYSVRDESVDQKAVDSTGMPNAVADASWLCAEARRGLGAELGAQYLTGIDAAPNAASTLEFKI